jgi:H+/Cl- antiporter ClcA
LENFKKKIFACIVINLLSLVVFIVGGRGYGEFYHGIPQMWGIRGVLALILAVVNIVVCGVYLKNRRLMIQRFQVKYSRLGAVFGILGAVVTLITEGVFTPIVAMGLDWAQGNLVGMLFVLPMVFAAVGIIAVVLLVAQLGFYLTSISTYILLYNKITQDNQTAGQMYKR